MAKKKLSQIVEPSIKFDGEKNILEKIFDGLPEDMPELKSVGYAKVSDGQHGFLSYTITSRGREIIKIEVEEPNLRAIAEESAKIAFVNNFSDPEL